MGILDGHTAFFRYRSWHKGGISEAGELSVEDGGDEGPFDVLLVPTRHLPPDLGLRAAREACFAYV